MLFGDSLAYLPEIEGVGINLSQSLLLLLLYRLLKSADRFFWSDLDRKHAIRII
jgi:hypothetical protein